MFDKYTTGDLSIILAGAALAVGIGVSLLMPDDFLGDFEAADESKPLVRVMDSLQPPGFVRK